MIDQQPISKYTEADILFATQSASKVEANKKTVQEIGNSVDIQVSIGSIDPEIFEMESNSEEPDQVAWDKTETLRKNVLFNPEKRTLIVAFDVVTWIAESPEDFESGKGEDLKRLLRQVDLNADIDSALLWESIINTLETERIRMMERCANGAFCIEWHIGFALNSSDQQVSNRGVLVLQASFSAFNPEVIMQAFALTDALEEKRTLGIRPTEKDLVNGVRAFAIGPRLPFVKLIPEYADPEKLKAFNRDFPDEVGTLSAEQFLSLVRDCALSPQMALSLLAGSEQEDGQIVAALDKETVKFNLSS